MTDSAADEEWEDPVDFWARAILVPVFAWWIPAQLPVSDAAAWGVTGGVLEIAGLLLTAHQLDSKVSEARNAPPFFKRQRRRVGRWWRRIRTLFGFEPEPPTVSGDGIVSEMSMGGVKLRGTLPPDPTLEQRVERLEDLAEGFTEQFNEARAERARLGERIAEVRSDLREADRRDQEYLQGWVVGDFRWELVALFWFVLGVGFAMVGQVVSSPSAP